MNLEKSLVFAGRPPTHTHTKRGKRGPPEQPEGREWTVGASLDPGRKNEGPGEPESQLAMAGGTGSEAGHLRVQSW